MHEQNKSSTKQWKSLRKNQKEILELENKINETKNEIECFNSSLNQVEEYIYEIRDRPLHIIQLEEKKEIKLKTNEESLCELWGTINQNTICLREVPEGQGTDKGTENLVTKIMAKNVPNLDVFTSMTIHDSTQRSLHQYIIIKLWKFKEKKIIMKAARKKRFITYKGTPIRPSAEFSAEALKARWEWEDIFKLLKGERNCKEYFTKTKLSFRN